MAVKKVYSLEGPLTTAMKYAVIGNSKKFKQKKHAWKAWRTLKRFHCVVYPVAEDLERIEGYKVYSKLAKLKGRVDVAVLCLPPEDYPELINDGKEAGIKYIWFQEQTYNDEIGNQCQEAGIEVVRGCVLKHKIYPKPWAFFNPCYWHGKGHPKVGDRIKRL